MIYAFGAYLCWGFFAAYFPLLLPASPYEIIGHRIIWTAVFMAIVLGVTGHYKQLLRASLRTWLLMGLGGALVAANWLIYVIAVNSTHVADAALGYFINPLVSLLLGMVFLHERLRPLQTVSVVIAMLAVLLLTFIGGHPPLIGLGLAFTFGFYGLVKKFVPLSSLASLAGETFVLAPFALGYVYYLESTDQGTFLGQQDISHSFMLISSGLVTAVPLLLFGKATQLTTLSTIGMLQYMTPTVQMLWALFVNHEYLAPIRWVGFCLIWVSVAIYLTSIVLHSRNRVRLRATATG